MELNLKTFALGYVCLISAATFFYFGWDKARSVAGRERVSEKMLWTLMLIGGTPGALLGMYYFRHKTKKLSFQAVAALILAGQITLTAWWFGFFQN